MRHLLAPLIVMLVMTAAHARSSSAAPGQVAAPALSCDGDEAKALLTAPKGTRRVSAHVLLVKFRSGSRQFIDPRPYREEMDGRRWRYCGYSPRLKAHLVGEEDDALFTGKLLLNDSGRLLEAGNTVYPSPDGKLFLAGRQTSGEYLEAWTISDLAGKALWTGPSGVTKGQALLVEYEDPRWIAARVLRVSAICNIPSRRQGEATLTLSGRSARWQSKLHCTG